MLKRKCLITILIAIVVALMLVPSTQASIGLPDYDSGWTSISQGQSITFTHDLGTTEVLVYVIGNSSVYGIHQYRYGSDCTTGGCMGLSWSKLTNTTITVGRPGADDAWDTVRVMIWKIEPEARAVGAVGGIYIPVNKLELLAPYIGLTILLAVAVMTVGYVKKRKRRTRIIS